MRWSLIMAGLLLPAAASAVPRTGDYLDVAYIPALAKTYSPLRAARVVTAAHLPEMVTVQAQGNARRLALSWGWQKGEFLAVLQRNGVLRRELAWGPAPDIGLRLVADSFCLTAPGSPEHCYRYVGNAQQYISRQILSGRYTDRQGAMFWFNADGTVHFPNYDASYTLMLDQSADRYDFFAIGTEGRFMAFRREAGTLTLYRVGPPHGASYGAADFTTPLAVLHTTRRPAILASN